MKLCKKCGQEFTSKSNRQMCCNKPIYTPCKICGKLMLQKCSISPQSETCSKACQTKLIKQRIEANSQQTIKVCKYCGKDFIPKNPSEIYCEGLHYAVCKVCGKSFEISNDRLKNHRDTCSEECRHKLSHTDVDYSKMVSTLKSTLQEKYGVDNIMQLSETVDKIKQTNSAKYGTEWYTQTREYKVKAKNTDLQKYGVEHHLQAVSVKHKRDLTNLKKYGHENILASDYGKYKIKSTLKARYGFEYASQIPQIRSKVAKSLQISKLEQRISDILDNYKIEYIHRYMISANGLSHEYDFYLPKYKILVDADGQYFHSYLSDPNGKQVRDDYDDIRLKLIPADHRLHIIVEGYEEQGVKQLTAMIADIDNQTFNYDSNIFEWCRSVEFPYPEYSIERMQKDYNSLCKYDKLSEYNPNCRLGESLIRNYHHSIYHAHCRNSKSPYEGWNDDEILKKTILNRLIYVNNVDPSKVLRGLYISKSAPRVSIFNPVLAKYIVSKYLTDFSSIFDPFSGYSGRLLGVTSLGKQYIGQDLNATAIEESNQIIDMLQLSDAQVICKDIFDSNGEYECLLTCPPYADKEIYGNETSFKSCDEWVDECLNRFKCHRYAFVVDDTIKYRDNVVGEIVTTSHLTKIKESIIILDN